MGTAQVEVLAAAIDALADLDLDALDDAELHQIVVAVQRQRARLGAAVARLIGRWDASGAWAGDGSRTAATRLARETSSAPATAAIELRRARRLRTMPATAGAVADGTLSLDHVDLLGRAGQPWRGDLFAQHEAGLVDACRPLRFVDAARVVDYWCQRADAAGFEADATRRAEAAHLHASTTLDGQVVVSGVLDPIGGAVVTDQLERIERDLYRDDQHTGRRRSPSQRRAAALVEMATRASTAPADGRRPRPLFTVLIGDHTFTRLCELATGSTAGTVTTPGQLTPHLTAADLETVVFDGPSTVVSVSRRRRFSGALRRAIEVRDRRCQHPSGCDVAADGCDVDHITPHHLGGLTGQHNGRLLCPTHNRHPDRHPERHAGPAAVPRPPMVGRPDRLDLLRARLRWRCLHAENEEDGDDDDADCAG